MNYIFKFDAPKALEVILYLANRCKNRDFYNILKYSYLADKQHLSKYGRFITGDIYWAMPKGTVPSHMYDMIKDERKDYKYHKHFNISGYKVNPQRDADLQFLSESDIECLDKIINEFGNKAFSGIHDASKDDAYDKNYKEGTSTPIPIDDIISVLPNSEEVTEYLSYNLS